MFCGLGGGLVSPSSAGAAAPLKPVDVWLHDAYFQVGPDGPITPPTLVYAKRYQWIVFHLADPQNTHRSVTVDPADCGNHDVELCDKAFDDPNMRYDDPNNHTVKFRWETEGEYDFFDHFSPATGKFIISSADQTVQPSATTTSSSTTTTTASTPTPAPPTTTTTAPTSIRPMLVPDPAPTTTTTRAATAPTTAPASKGNDKDKGKAKKASAPSTPTTAAPGPDGTMPPDSVFDPAALTPAPTLMSAPDGSNSDEAAINASAAASLLDPQKDGDDGSKLLLMAFGTLVAMLMVGGGWAWFTRASRYDPA